MLLTAFNFITAALYLLASVTAWSFAGKTSSAHAQHHAHQPVGNNSDKHEASAFNADKLNAAKLSKILLWLAIMLHAAALADALVLEDGFNIGFSHAVSLIVWLSIVSYVVLGNDARLTRLAALYLAPFAVAAALLPTLLPAQRIVMYGGWAFKLHIAVAILAYALFTVAALHALLMLFLDKRLHAGTIDVLDNNLPPLLAIEKLLFRLLGVAFILLTATLISGVFFSESLFGKAFETTHKTVFAVMSWIIFGGLLAGHWKLGWRGTVAVRWTLIGFAMLLLSYVGSKFVLEIILKRY